jgi:sterol desaturase/sphingolipid hydroxylase (fatty acid hydroxylase superfamily)
MNSNLFAFDKKSFLKFIYFQHIVLFIAFNFIFLLTYKKYSPIVITLSIFFVCLYSYFYHVIAHKIPRQFNIHTLFHHNHKDNEKQINFIINLIIETFFNIFLFYIIYKAQQIMNVNYIPNIIIFFIGLLYTSVHIINYSIFHLDQAHVLHHLSNNDKTCNFGFDALDHLFGTNCNNKYENMCHFIPNILLTFLITYYVYKPKLF